MLQVYGWVGGFADHNLYLYNYYYKIPCKAGDFFIGPQQYLRNVLPSSFLTSIQNVSGFDEKAFMQVHESEQQITSVRLNPAKKTVSQHFQQPTKQVPWCKHGLYLPERPFFTFDPLLHAGAYYVQEASSMFLWQVLEQTVPITTNKKVLDLCAAPGGKSTLLASYFTDGLIVSNEIIKSRAAILTENISKWGNANSIVTNNDPADFQQLEGWFDVLVIDAPCSGSGLFRKDPSAIKEWSTENVALCSRRQKRIVNDVFPALKQDGILIYSTCSYSKEEDEDIADALCSEFELESIRLAIHETWGIVETHSDLHKAWGYRFYPDKLAGEGFFIAAFRKKQVTSEQYVSTEPLIQPTKSEAAILDAFEGLPSHFFHFKHGSMFKTIPRQWTASLQQLASSLYIKKAGIELGEIKGKDFIPAHELAISTAFNAHESNIELNLEQSLQYLRRKEIQLENKKGWHTVSYCGLPLGWVKVLPNRVNNYYPNGWRILKD